MDRSSWAWKDEDELAEGVALGLFSEADASWLHHWGERAVEHLVLRQPPFDVDWEDWQPDPSWPTPELPPGWDRRLTADRTGQPAPHGLPFRLRPVEGSTT